MQFYTIGQLAREAGVNLSSVRYCERRGLLPKPPRTPGGHRQYADEDLKRVWFIKSTQALGFSLAEIAELLSIRVAAGCCTAGGVDEATLKSAGLGQPLP